MSLENQVILITGAAGGIGSAVALALALEGARIILLDKNLPKLESIYDQINGANAPEPILYPFDLAGANENDYLELAERIEEKYGALQGLLHTAAEFTGFKPMLLQTTQDWGHSLNVNLNAPFLLTRVLLPVLQKSEQASIVFTSDSSVRTPLAYAGAYGIGKIALEGFAKILAEELEAFKKVRVNTVVPGPVASPIRKKAFPAEDTTLYLEMPVLMRIYAYLFSRESIGLSGQTIDARTFFQSLASCQIEKVSH
jgi:NAD(P)-dependent dehydrogenase (short-subunit alcohol dehydrogenase family)